MDHGSGTDTGEQVGAVNDLDIDDRLGCSRGCLRIDITASSHAGLAEAARGPEADRQLLPEQSRVSVRVR
jgi:hypothetical protein